MNYIICSSPRSGTKFICSILRQLGVGFPFEIITGGKILYYKEPDFVHRINNLITETNLPIKLPTNISNSNILKWIRQVGNQNKIWGTVLHMSQMERGYCDYLKDVLDIKPPSYFEIINTLAPNSKFIFLYRINKIKQAISNVKKIQRGKYKYDKLQIESCVNSRFKEDIKWLDFFNKNNIIPHILSYESLDLHTAESIKGILDFLELDFVDQDSLSH